MDDHIKIEPSTKEETPTWQDFSLEDEVYSGIQVIDQRGNKLKFEGHYTLTKKEDGSVELRHV